MVAIMVQLILVTGAGGFIGHHLTTFPKRQRHKVRGVDMKRPRLIGHDSIDQHPSSREPDGENAPPSVHAVQAGRS